MSTKTSVDLPVAILFDPWLTSTEVRVWGAYRARANKDLETTVTIGDVADLIGVERITAAKAVGALTKAGYMVRTSGGSSPNRRLVVP